MKCNRAGCEAVPTGYLAIAIYPTQEWLAARPKKEYPPLLRIIIGLEVCDIHGAVTEEERKEFIDYGKLHTLIPSIMKMHPHPSIPPDIDGAVIIHIPFEDPDAQEFIRQQILKKLK